MLTSNLFLLSIAVLTLVVCVVLGAVLYFALHGANNKPAAGADRKIVRLRSDSLRSAFREAVELIEGNIASRGERYNIPWIMVLGEGEDPRPLPIAQAGVASVLSAEAASPAATQGISWHFFDRGIVVDIKAAYLGSPEDDGDEKPWDEFLGLCRNYRPQRPFDSVVITVPAATLLADDTDAQLELVRHAKLAHRRLWLAQNRFAMRFAVYVVVTGCESLTGFAPFARALPETLRSSMLGWSSPYDLSTTYSSDWVDTAMRSIMRSVSDSSAELFALDAGQVDARELLLLPSRIEAMGAQLQRYVDELLRASAYHEPFFFRGIYLTGDSSEFAQWSAAQGSAALHDPLAAPGADAGPATDPLAPDAAWPVPAGDVLDGRREPGGSINELMLQPAFLRDLFEKKIFSEYGLTRPSRSQYLARPVMSRALRWGGIALLGGWGIGLVVATVQLSHRNGELVAALGSLHRNAQDRAAAAQQGQDLPADWYRRNALSLIAMNQNLKTGSGWAVFMPGSWGVFDDLNVRVKERFEREFGQIAVAALTREMYARVSQLSGESRDPSTGQLIIGDDCTAPAMARGDAPGAASLSIDDLPQMRALQQYVGSVDQLDAALQAFQRLQTPSRDNADALRLVVRYALGAELQGSVAGTLPYFYRNQDVRGMLAANTTGSVNLPVIQQALRCTFDKGAQQVNSALFANNPLLAAERSTAGHLNDLSTGNGSAANFTQLSGNARAIVAGIDAQRDLLASGKGGWLRQAQFTPGPVYERTLARAAQSRLLGPDLASQVRERDDTAFRAFRTEFALHVDAPDSGLVWLDKDARYAVSPGRQALRDGLSNLLGQPFMTAPRDRSLPALTQGSTIVWDRAQLDAALALGDVRKRFITEGLTNMPATVRPSIEQALNVQFAQLILDQTAAAAAVTPSSSDTDSAAFDASRARLVRIQALLTEMNASAQVEDLNGLMSRDALAHLRLVDDALTQSELYATRESVSYDGARVGRSPVLAAFGVADAGALAVYLDQQSARVLSLGKNATVFLGALDATDAASPLAQRWQAITRDLERYRLKNPNSSLLRLEQFVMTVSGDPGVGNCMAKFGGRPASNGADDFFAALHARLYDRLLSRCSQSYVLDLRQQWDGFAAAFNQNLAGRSPFSGANMIRVASRAELGSADFGEVGQVLRRYAAVSETFHLAHAGAGGQHPLTSAAVRKFVDNFDQVKTLLAPLYPGDDGAPTGYDVSIEFRANRDAEVAANQVIDWTMSIGAQSVSMSDPPRTLHWDYGTPVTLVLRFAMNSPLSALNDPQQRALSTDGRTLTWQFADPWALLSFIGRQRVADSSLRGDSASQLLALEFPLGTVNPADLSLLPKQARGRAFVRVTLMPAGKKTPLLWPGSFPARAPDWTSL